MFKKTMTFDDLDGNEVSQTFYFNFNKKEIAELLEFGAIQKFAVPGKVYVPLETAMERLSTPVEVSGLTEQENTLQAYNIFQDLILDAYGVKGDDNVTFKKNKELRNYWESHVAYVELIWEFVGNPPLMGEFMESCFPPKMLAAAKKEMQKTHGNTLTSETLADMINEAERRQQDPATRIEPGLEAAQEALQPAPEVVVVAKAVADSGEPEKKIEDLTESDILAMDEVSFKKLDIQKLSKEQMQIAFRRKLQG